MKKLTFIIVTFLLAFTGNAQEYKNTFIPQPESVVIQSGGFELSNETQVFIPKSYYKDLKPIIASKLSDDVGLEIAIKTGRVTTKSNYILFEYSYRGVYSTTWDPRLRGGGGNKK